MAATYYINVAAGAASTASSPMHSGPSSLSPSRSQHRPAREVNYGEYDYDDAELEGDAEAEEDDEDIEAMEGYKASNDMINESTIKSGYLAKRGEKRKTWKKRWFVLRSSKLSYYKNDKEYQILRFIDIGDIKTVASVELKKNDHTFGIVTPKRTFYVKASSKPDMDSWIETLNHAMTQYAHSTTLTQEIAALEIGSPELTAPLPPQRSNSQDRPDASARPISINIPNISTSASPSQPRPIPGSNAFSPFTVTSESEAGAERFGLSYASSTGHSMASSPGRPDQHSSNPLFGGQSPGAQLSAGDISESGYFQKRNSQAYSSSPRQRSLSAGRMFPPSSGDPPASPGLASTPANILSSSEEEDDWDEEENADRAMPLPELNPQGIPSQVGQISVGAIAAAAPSASATATVGSDLTKDPNKIITQGYLMKQSGRRKVWRKRWFVLTTSRLLYTRSHMDAKAQRQIPINSILDAIEYESKKQHNLSPSSPGVGSPGSAAFNLPSFGSSVPDADRDTPMAANPSGQGSISDQRSMLERRGSVVAAAAGVASNISASLKKKKENCFQIITPKRTFIVCAPTEEEEIKWMSALKTLINRQRSASQQQQQIGSPSPSANQSLAYALPMTKNPSAPNIPVKISPSNLPINSPPMPTMASIGMAAHSLSLPLAGMTPGSPSGGTLVSGLASAVRPARERSPSSNGQNPTHSANISQ